MFSATKDIARSTTAVQDVELSHAYCTQLNGLFESVLCSQWQRKRFNTVVMMINRYPGVHPVYPYFTMLVPARLL
eukprot:COSAG02_NODE_6981_length_3249_cov_3.293651_3_plen_75_part_00